MLMAFWKRKVLEEREEANTGKDVSHKRPAKVLILP